MGCAQGEAMRATIGNAIAVESSKLFGVHIIPQLALKAGHGAIEFSVFPAEFQPCFGHIPFYLPISSF